MNAAGIPIMRWLPRYERRSLRRDVLAGAAVSALLIPQSLGYARIAGVPVQVGLYAIPLALLAYAVLGSSPQLVVGPASTVSIVSGSLVHDIARDPSQAVAVTGALAIAAGLVLLGIGLLRVGWMAEFLSKPVVTGFVFGLTLTIIIGELPTMLGIPKPSGDLLGVFVGTLRSLGDVQTTTTIVGGIALITIFVGHRILSHAPWGLLALVVGVTLTGHLDFGDGRADTVGRVPKGLPPIGLPMIERAQLGSIAIGGVSLALVALAEGLSATRLFASRGGYRIETTNEFVGLGAANIAAGLSGGLAVTGSLSKTAANAQAGGRSQVSGLTAAVIVMAVLVSLTWFFENLPRAVLSAIVIAAVWNLMDVASLRRFARIRRADFVAATTGATAVVLFGPLAGLIIAIVVSLLAIIYRSSSPKIEVLGRIKGEKAAWGRLSDHPDRRPKSGVLVVRPASPLFWANAGAIEERLTSLVEQWPDTRALVLDLEATTQLDTTSADVLDHLVDVLAAQHIGVYLARVLHPVEGVLDRSGLLGKLGPGRSWHSISQCVRAARRDTGLTAPRQPDA